MTGWRVGWVCAPRAPGGAVHRVHQYTMLCAPHVTQVAAIEALRSRTTTSPRWSPTTTGAGGCSSRACASWGWTAPSPAARSTRSRRSAERTGLRDVRRAAAARRAGRRGARQRVRALGRGTRPLLLRHRAAAAGGGPRADGPLPGVAHRGGRPGADQTTRARSSHGRNRLRHPRRLPTL